LIFQREEMRTFSDFIQEWFFTTSLNGFIFTQSFSHKKKWESKTHGRGDSSQHHLTDLFLIDHFLTKRNGEQETYGRRSSSSLLVPT
jgi:hypothetical protein